MIFAASGGASSRERTGPCSPPASTPSGEIDGSLARRALFRWSLLKSYRGLRAEAIHLPLGPQPSLHSRREVHNLMMSNGPNKSCKSASSQ